MGKPRLGVVGDRRVAPRPGANIPPHQPIDDYRCTHDPAHPLLASRGAHGAFEAGEVLDANRSTRRVDQCARAWPVERPATSGGEVRILERSEYQGDRRASLQLVPIDV